MQTVTLEDSTRLQADVVIWACWPTAAETLSGISVSLRVTQQELRFFDVLTLGAALLDIPVGVDDEQSRGTDYREVDTTFALARAKATG